MNEKCEEKRGEINLGNEKERDIYRNCEEKGEVIFTRGV